MTIALFQKFTPETVALLLEEGGFQARIELLKEGTVIWSGAHGLEFRVMFVKSDDEPEVGMTCFQLDGNDSDDVWSYEQINEFNAGSLGGVVFLTEPSTITLQNKHLIPWKYMDQNLFTRLLASWLGDLRNFVRLSS